MSDCIIWDGPIVAQGRYGMTTLNGKSIGAHRAAWILANGEIPHGLLVCHKCDNGLCVNPDHLFLGTYSDNMRDAVGKGRIKYHSQSGQNNHNAKPNLVPRNKAIQADRDAGMTYSDLRLKYEIKSNGHLRSILTKIWD